MTRVLVTGATGYIGSLLVPRLLATGLDVRVLTRHPDRLADWSGDVQIVQGDAGNADDVSAALRDVDVAYYLLHSMDGRGDFVARDRELASLFAAQATVAGISRIVYLSGLHPTGALSEHLASRVEVGEILLDSDVPAVVLQAGVVLGAGSASFDMLRHLTERLPAMVAPRWLDNRIQPIAVDDVMDALVAAAHLPADVNRTLDIGGPDVLTYREMMHRYAALAGLWPRTIVTVPVLTPGLAGRWVSLITPISSGIARPLVGSLMHDAVRSEHDAERVLGLPPAGALGFDEAVRRALADVDPTAWSRTLAAVGAGVLAAGAIGAAARATGRRHRRADTSPWAGSWPVATILAGLVTVAAGATIADARERGRSDQADAFARALVVNLVLGAGAGVVLARAHAPGWATAAGLALTVSSADLARRSAPHGRGKAGVLALYAGWCAATLARVVARR